VVCTGPNLKKEKRKSFLRLFLFSPISLAKHQFIADSRARCVLDRNEIKHDVHAMRDADVHVMRREQLSFHLMAMLNLPNSIVTRRCFNPLALHTSRFASRFTVHLRCAGRVHFGSVRHRTNPRIPITVVRGTAGPSQPCTEISSTAIPILAWRYQVTW
jgi:hypothetical protein